MNNGQPSIQVQKRMYIYYDFALQLQQKGI